MERKISSTGILLSLLALVLSGNVHAQTYLPLNFTIEGRLFDTGSPAAPINDVVDIQLELIDPGAPTCVIYREVHDGVDVSSGDSSLVGRFAVRMGSGTTVNFGGANSLVNAFGGKSVTGDNNGDNAADPACALTPAAATNFQVRISIKQDIAANFGAPLTPNTVITSIPQALAAETLQGRTPNEFLQINTTGHVLTQANLESIFTAANFAELSALLAGTSTQYLDAGGGSLSGNLNMGSNTITNVGAPSAGGDAVNKTYADGNLAGSSIALTGISAGNVLIWNGSRWEAQAPSTIDNTKLPLAGGTVTGPTTFSGNLFSSHITMNNQTLFMPGRYTNAQEGGLTLAAGDEGRLLYNTDDNILKIWDGTGWNGSVRPGGTAGGDLSGSYPNPVILDGAITNTKIADDAVLSRTLDQAGIGMNRLVISDNVTGNAVRFKTCSINQILRWEATGWQCVDVSTALPNSTATAGTYGSSSMVSRIGINAQGVVTSAVDVAIDFPVVSVNGKTGAVILNGADLGLGTASLENVGNGNFEIPKTDGSGKLNPSVIPTPTSVDATAIRGVNVATTAPSSQSQFLGYNGSAWVPKEPNYNDLINGAGVFLTYQPNGASCLPNEVLKWNGSAWMCGTDNSGGSAVTFLDTTTDLTGGPINGTGTIGVNTGTLANQILKLNPSAQIPAVDGSQLTNINAVKLRSENISTTTPTANQVLRYNGFAWEAATLTDNTGITFVAMGSGLIPGDISATGTITIDVGTGPNQIIQLNGSSQLPAVDGSMLTNLNAASIRGVNISTTFPTTGQVLHYNGSAWEAYTPTDAGIVSLVGLNGALVTGSATVKTINIDTGVTAGQILQVAAGDRLPIIDGSQLTQISNLRNFNVSTTPPTSNQVLQYNGSAWEAATLTDNAGVTFVAMGTGMASGNISGTGTINIDVGTGSNQIVQLDGSARLPSIDARNLMQISNLRGENVSTVSPVLGQVLRYNGSAWEAASVAGSNGAQGEIQFASSTAGQFNSNSAFFWDNTNIRLGIGLNSPAEKLDITWSVDGPVTALIHNGDGGNAAISRFKAQNSASSMTTGITGTGFAINGLLDQNSAFFMGDSGVNSVNLGSAGASPVRFFTNNQERTRIDPIGRVGIGTTAPHASAILDIQGTGNLSAIIVPRATTADRPFTAANGMIRYNTSLAKFEVYENDNWVNMVGETGGAYLPISGGALAGQLRISDGDSTNPSIAFTSDPDTGLYRNGGGAVSLSYNGSPKIEIGTDIVFPSQNLSGGTGTYFVRGASSGSNSNPTYSFPTSQDTGMYLPAAATVAFATGGQERMRLGNSGIVGIGTTTPNPAAILDVNGTGNLSAIIVPRATTAERPVAATNGMIRYNTNTSKLEGFVNNIWQDVVTGTISPGVTKIDDLSDAYSKDSPEYNLALGDFALMSRTAGGNWNIAIGSAALLSSTNGSANTAIGGNSLGSVISGSNNTAIGMDSLMDVTGNDNTALGTWSATNIDGNANVAIGRSAMGGAGGAGIDQNTAVGALSLNNISSGDFNTALGYNSGSNITTGSKNIVIGFDIHAPVPASSNQLSIGNLIYGTGVNTGSGTTISDGRVGIMTSNPQAALDIVGTGSASAILIPRGTSAERGDISPLINGMIRFNTTNLKFEGFENGSWKDLILGAPSIDSLTDGRYDANQNLALGDSAHQFSPTGLMNVAVGNMAQNSLSTGSENVAVGAQSLQNIASGYQNTGAGTSTLLQTNSGYENTALGFLAGSKTTGNQNTALGALALGDYTVAGVSNRNLTIGYRSGYALSGADDNTLVGYRAGDGITTGDRNILIGYDIDTPSPTTTSFLSIGNLVFATGVGTGVGTATSGGRVGIATNAPQAVLDVVGTGSASALIVPRGSDAERGQISTMVNGMIRYNINTSRFEAVENGAWTSMIGGDFRSDGSIPMSGQFRAATGAAGAPAYSFNGDSNTGIWNSIADTLGFVSGGSQIVAIGPSGVGIGTTNTNYRMTIQSPGGNQEVIRVQTGLNGVFRVIHSAGGGWPRMSMYNASTQETVNIDANGLSWLNGGNVGIGSSSPTALLDVLGTGTATTGEVQGQSVDWTYTPSAASTADVTAQKIDLKSSGSGSLVSASLTASAADINHVTNVPLGNAQGLAGTVNNSSTGTITNAIGISASVTASSGTITNGKGLTIGQVQGTNAYGIEIGDIDGTTNSYGIYQLGADDKNYFAGQTGIGVLPSVGAILDIQGTGALSSMIVPRGPTSGRHPTAATDGMLRYNTSYSKFEVYENLRWRSLATIENVPVSVCNIGTGVAGGSCSVTGNDNTMTITLNVGATGSTANQAAATVSFSSSSITTPICVFSAANGNAAGLAGAPVYISATPTSVSIYKSTGTAWPSTGNFIWTVICLDP